MHDHEPDTTARVARETVLRGRTLAGDEAAWRCLYDSSFDNLLAYAFHHSDRDLGRAEDVVQECWMVAVRRIRCFDPTRGSFSSWLRGICDNVLRNERRRLLRRRWHERALDAASEPESPQNAESSGGSEFVEQLALAFAALPRRYQELLREKYGAHRSVAEIAKRTGATEKSVESMLFRARCAFTDVYAALVAKT